MPYPRHRALAVRECGRQRPRRNGRAHAPGRRDDSSLIPATRGAEIWRGLWLTRQRTSLHGLQLIRCISQHLSLHSSVALGAIARAHAARINPRLLTVGQYPCHVRTALLHAQLSNSCSNPSHLRHVVRYGTALRSRRRRPFVRRPELEPQTQSTESADAGRKRGRAQGLWYEI